MKAKIGLFDIETAPSLGYYFDLWKEGNIVKRKVTWYILSWSFKLDNKLITKGLIDYPNFTKNKEDDSALVRDLHKLVSEADILIAHNGDKFDIKKTNTRFIKHGLPPPAPYKTIDTLKVAKKHFAFESNRLDDLGEFLGVGRKLKHQGIDLWMACMNGDPTAWQLMKKYNKQDVLLLERIYNKLLPWIQTHPPVALRGSCSNCGSPSLQSRGQGFNKRGTYFKYQCTNCFAWSTGPTEKQGLSRELGKLGLGKNYDNRRISISAG